MSKPYLALLVVPVLLAGCGNHGRLVTTAQTAPRRTAPAPVVGDAVQYEMTITGQIGISGSSMPIDSSSHRDVTVTEAANHGGTVPSSITRTFEIREESVQSVGVMKSQTTVISWLGEDAAGNLYLLGESLDGVTWDVVTDRTAPIYMPAVIGPGSSWKYCARFASGNTESCDNTCLGAEDVTTPAGSFRALKVSTKFSRTGVRGTDVNLQSTKWLAQDIPCVLEVKSEYDMTSSIAGSPCTTHSVETMQSFHRGR